MGGILQEDDDEEDDDDDDEEEGGRQSVPMLMVRAFLSCQSQRIVWQCLSSPGYRRCYYG